MAFGFSTTNRWPPTKCVSTERNELVGLVSWHGLSKLLLRFHSFTRSLIHICTVSERQIVAEFNSAAISHGTASLFSESAIHYLFFIITLHYFQIFDWSYRKCVCDICNVPCAKCATFTIFQLISSTSSVADWSTLIPLRIVTSIEKQRKETMRERLIFFVSVHWIGFLPCGFF